MSIILLADIQTIFEQILYQLIPLIIPIFGFWLIFYTIRDFLNINR